MTPEAKAALRRAAEEATPGRWFAGRKVEDGPDSAVISIGPYDLSNRPNKPSHYEDTIAEVWAFGEHEHDGEANAAFIALCDPQTIIGLLDNQRTPGTWEACNKCGYGKTYRPVLSIPVDVEVWAGCEDFACPIRAHQVAG